MKLKMTVLFTMAFCALFAQGVKREITISKKYLNFPVEHAQERQRMAMILPGTDDRSFVIRLSDGDPDYWVFSDVSAFIGKTIEIEYPKASEGLANIYQSDEINGADSLYKESKRPQFHFSPRRGWNNDPNGMVYNKGEYHLYYQHNPYERNWENMHWGHAVSKDMIHWEELPDALYPDSIGTMFSGTATVDFENTSGFKTGDEDVIVAAYTADSPGNEVQCIAYSNDRGRTFQKYSGNPVIDTKEKWGTKNLRDPKIFWHAESGKWVMVLFEKTGMSFFNSDNLKDWDFQSHTGGFWECPELFELPVDGDKENTRWVLYGASGTYILGSFDGKVFTPETDKLRYFRGKMYAGQTFNNIPKEDGRRIQIGWGQIEQPGMPFSRMMMFPNEFTLRTTKEGVRLFSEPIAEIEHLHEKSYKWENLTREEANEKLKNLEGDVFRIKMKVKLLDGTDFSLKYNGNSILHYDMNWNNLNGEFYGGDQIENLTFYYEILVDRTSVEIFADHGKFSLVAQLQEAKNKNGFEFDKNWATIKIEELEINELKSIWE
ncbi:GH32 C-terminal domain-containing protein [Sunxiuqinia sp. A32]|uniref:GH32 C-terminal domain-containing protein n=1 Tax=Sunxiuqinia sp. A32 TaxID=3461496 RepID=UPI0040463DA9